MLFCRCISSCRCEWAGIQNKKKFANCTRWITSERRHRHFKTITRCRKITLKIRTPFHFSATPINFCEKWKSLHHNNSHRFGYNNQQKKYIYIVDQHQPFLAFFSALDLSGVNSFFLSIGGLDCKTCCSDKISCFVAALSSNLFLLLFFIAPVSTLIRKTRFKYCQFYRINRAVNNSSSFRKLFNTHHCNTKAKRISVRNTKFHINHTIFFRAFIWSASWPIDYISFCRMEFLLLVSYTYDIEHLVFEFLLDVDG